MNEEQNTTAPQEVTPESEVATSAGAEPGKSNMRVIATVLAAVILILAGLYYFIASTPKASLDLQPLSTGDAAQSINDYPEVVAVVNGEELSRDEFLMSFRQAAQAAAQAGNDVNDATVQNQLASAALDHLIDNTLLLQAAKDSGVQVSQEDVVA